MTNAFELVAEGGLSETADAEIAILWPKANLLQQHSPAAYEKACRILRRVYDSLTKIDTEDVRTMVVRIEAAER